jgi:cytochrome c oxidase cbb3-type subunit III
MRPLLPSILATAALAFCQDLTEGKRIYNAQCASCHGIRGDGGRGATLAKPKLRHAPDGKALEQVIGRGIAGSEMPRSALAPEQVRQVAAYVRSLGKVTPSAVTGDTRKGKAIVLGKGGCRDCHAIDGEGAGIGPDLSDIGARRSAAYLRAALLEPSAEVPEGFLEVRLVTRDGKTITGPRVNEDTFSIQVRDLKNEVHSYWKSELAELHKDRGHSPMPSYRGRLSPAELDDVIAYLAGLE